MPTSKKPRKKGKHGRENAIVKGLMQRRKFKSREEARDFVKKSFDKLDQCRRDRRPVIAQIHHLISLQDKGELIESFTRAFFSLERWPTTDDPHDFNCVSSSLMLGVLCHKRLGVQEKDLLEDMQHAAFMAVTCARLRNHQKPVPTQNLEAVRIGLTTAQELMEFAYDNDRQAFIDVLKHNDREHVQNTPGLLEAHERIILGKNYEIVQRWELEDEQFLMNIKKEQK